MRIEVGRVTRRAVGEDTPALLTSKPERFAFAGLMLFAMVAATFLQNGIAVLTPFLSREFDLSPGQLGLLGTVIYVAAALTSPRAGALVDVLGGRRIAMVLFVLSASALFAFSAAPSYAWLLFTVAFGGLALATGNPVTNHLLSTHIAPGQRGLLVGIKQSGVKVSQFLTGAILPAAALTLGWRTALRLAAIVILAGAVVAYLRIPPSPRGRHAGRRIRGRREPLGPTVWRLAAFAALMGTGSSAVNFHLPLYAFDHLALDERTAGLTVGVMGLIGVFARVAWGPAAERFRSPSLPLVILSVGAVTAQSLVWASDTVGLFLLWIGVVGLGLTAAVWNTVANYAIITTAGRQTGRASGVLQTAFVLGLSVGPVSFGAAVEATGSYHIGFAGVTAAFTLAALVAAQWWRTARPVDGDEQKGGSTTP